MSQSSTNTAAPTTTQATMHNHQDIAALVQNAVATKLPIVDYGVAHQGLGNPAPANATRLALDSPKNSKGVVEHYSRDFTVRAWAGGTIGELFEALASDNQFIPIDADPDITIGEVINHNVYGALRTGYNAIRDISLGLRYIDGLGQDIHVGGRTVKNVAGYDVTRLMVGSLGQLGIIYDVTVRTYAIPIQVEAASVRLEKLQTIDNVIPGLLQSDAAPARLHANYNPATSSWTLHSGYHGMARACQVQTQSFKAKLSQAAPGSEIKTQTTDLKSDLAELTAQRAWRRTATALLKVVVPPTLTGQCADSLISLAIPRLLIDALPTHGVLFIGGNLTAEQARTLDIAAGELITRCGGIKVWHNRPAGAQNLPSFAPPQNDWSIIAKLKATMDPHGIFNPGRLV